LPQNAEKYRVFDLRSDELPHTGVEDEFSIDEYLDAQEPEIQAAVDAQGPWVAETLYGEQKSLAALRLRAGLSQKALAERCGCEQPHISRYESGSTVPNLFAAKRIADALGVSLDQLAEAMHESLTRETA
jgi:DNA-binding XRE family transcriptional regulator